MMDLSVERDSLGTIGSEAFSTSPEILSEETHSLIACPSDDYTHTDAKQGTDSVQKYFSKLHICVLVTVNIGSVRSRSLDIGQVHFFNFLD